MILQLLFEILSMKQNKYLKEDAIQQFSQLSNLLEQYLKEKIINYQLLAWINIKNKTESASTLNSSAIPSSLLKNCINQNMKKNQYCVKANTLRKMHTCEDEVYSGISTKSQQSAFKKQESEEISSMEEKGKELFVLLQNDDEFESIVMEKIERLQQKFQKIRENQRERGTSKIQKAQTQKLSISLLPEHPKYIKLPKIKENSSKQLISEQQIKDLIPKLNLEENFSKHKNSTKEGKGKKRWSRRRQNQRSRQEFSFKANLRESSASNNSRHINSGYDYHICYTPSPSISQFSPWHHSPPQPVYQLFPVYYGHHFGNTCKEIKTLRMCQCMSYD